MSNYQQIFRRKSFHRFKETIPLTNKDIELINHIINNVTPLDNNIRFKTILVKEKETSCRLGAEYCLLFYSEIKDLYLENIGYIGEQIDLALTSYNIGTLWCGLGKPKETSYDGLDYVIMICIGKVEASSFRENLISFKRKSINKTWKGKLLPFSKDVILAPSAVNSQPWFVENNHSELLVYRNLSAAKFGIVPLKVMHYYNKIDMGIYLLFLETCLNHFNYEYERILNKNQNSSKKTKILVSKYVYSNNL